MLEVSDNQVYEAACKVRPYLDSVVPERAAEVNATLSGLLAGRNEAAMDDVRSVFASDPRLAEWLWSLLDDPLGLPPELQLRRAAPDVLVLASDAVPAVPYRCPGTDGYVRYRRSTSEPVGNCPDCGQELKP